LLQQLEGDLDWIAMKCLEKDRTRRYETANGLMSDIQRHLKNEPVMARPPSNLYRLQKLVRRNKLVFAAAGAVAAVLVLGSIVSMWQTVRARQPAARFFCVTGLVAGQESASQRFSTSPRSPMNPVGQL
jgi:eukaryotic-like serine/threonine-protein kinase